MSYQTSARTSQRKPPVVQPVKKKTTALRKNHTSIWEVTDEYGSSECGGCGGCWRRAPKRR